MPGLSARLGPFLNHSIRSDYVLVTTKLFANADRRKAQEQMLRRLPAFRALGKMQYCGLS